MTVKDTLQILKPIYLINSYFSKNPLPAYNLFDQCLIRVAYWQVCSSNTTLNFVNLLLYESCEKDHCIPKATKSFTSFPFLSPTCKFSYYRLLIIKS